MYAESVALLHGLERCVAGGFLQVDIESDSLLVIQILKHQIAPPWSIRYVVRRIGVFSWIINFFIHLGRVI